MEHSIPLRKGRGRGESAETLEGWTDRNGAAGGGKQSKKWDEIAFSTCSPSVLSATFSVQSFSVVYSYSNPSRTSPQI
jgi:hypothetical protein